MGNQLAKPSLGGRGKSRPSLPESSSRIIGIADRVQEREQGIALDQPRGTDLDGRHLLNELLCGPGLKFEELLEIAPGPVRTNRAGDTLADQG